jgi:hypothetical protein
MSRNGAFLMSREIFDNPIWSDPLKFRLFFFIVGNAVFSDDGVNYSGIQVKRGQFLRSLRNLQDDLTYREGRGNAIKKPPLETLRRKIKELEKEGRITTKSTEYGTLFTVVNYDKYQGFDHYKSGEMGQQWDSDESASGQRWDNNNNVNNDNNVNNVVVDNDTAGNFERAIIDRYMQLAGIGGFDIPERDKTAVRQVINAGIPIEMILALLDQCFRDYQPRHARDKINSFNYCATYIMNKYYQKKEGVNNVYPFNSRSYGGTKSQSQSKPEPILGENFSGRVRRNRA